MIYDLFIHGKWLPYNVTFRRYIIRIIFINLLPNKSISIIYYKNVFKPFDVFVFALNSLFRHMYIFLGIIIEKIQINKSNYEL